MRYLATLALLAAACAGTPNGDQPKNRADSVPHPDFARIRPNTIALLRVSAPTQELRTKLRREVYDRLFAKRYACLKLQSVDANTGAGGKFDGGTLEWDATFHVHVAAWKPVEKGRYVAATGSARMMHKNGEQLWECKFSNYQFEVDSRAGRMDHTRAIRGLANVIDRELPQRPPLPRE